MLKILDLSRKFYYPCRNISTAVPVFKESKRKVKETVELVTLVDQNDKILGLKAKTESEKLARKLNLTLERVYDTKYGKTYPAYKMMSPADLLKAEKKISSAQVLKKLPINYLISDNDLMTKIKVIKKWLTKNCEVHISIMGNSEVKSRMKNVFSKMEEELKSESRILNIRHKEDGIKFILMQPKQVKQAEKETDSKKAANNPAEKETDSKKAADHAAEKETDSKKAANNPAEKETDSKNAADDPAKKEKDSEKTADARNL